MVTSISTMGQSTSQVSRLKTMQVTLADLQLQLSSGKKTQKFSGLGTSAIVSARSRADFNALETYTNNITIADRRIKTMVVAIEELQAQAGNIANIVAGEIQEGEIDLERVNDLATNVMSFMEDLVNTKDEGRYVFSGAASNSQPLSLNGGTLETFLQGQLSDWQNDTIDSASLISSYRNANDTLVGFNAELSNGRAGNVTVRADTSAEVDYTTLGNAAGFKDIIIATKMLSELTVTDSTQLYHLDKIKLDVSDFDGATLPTDLPKTAPPGSTSLTLPADLEDETTLQEFRDENQVRADNFFAVFNDLGRMINSAIDDLDQLRFSLESDRARLSSIKDVHILDKNTTLGAISDVEDSDINEVALDLNFLQIQLEASYQVTATISNLNLSNYL